MNFYKLNIYIAMFAKRVVTPRGVGSVTQLTTIATTSEIFL